MKSLSGTAIYIVGMLAMEKRDVENTLEKLVESVRSRRDYDSLDFIAIHNQIKRITSRYVQLINEIETLNTKLDH
ncbi:hypothetical protein G7L40_20070 [Paenibacillus polymyxa]|uniref:Uncharacterized protein n=1 Tax=Paenibacillus polymyxa TaxID=1406 RepID=A0A378XZC8_PAEPO|nr:hypothetical protein [Paenibacillus polymyxa]MBE7896214.1 hypothetical protein [Paenibacillus polymyxa]MBG9765851.1 hypothetical protein [Paenibacillus polymyxa]MCC3256743.1 hypothetical protein [Paenibacillus polymyxa]QPK54769.1 hypothetical protein G7035_20110 [Paenibacillus polymyxa]QPK59860.1 hypothetical protein G7L40_20070 [Paenibacillus polymyxa]